MNSCMKRFLELYKPQENLTKPDDEILNFGRQMLPEEIVELWEEYGFGEYGDGLIKVIDPREYMNSLYTWLGQKDFNKIPIIMTAFGDIFYYRKLEDNENDISILDIHYRKIDVCTYSYEDFFEGYISDKNIIKRVLRKDLFNEAVKTLGQLKYEEIFFFAPALVLGGAENIKYVKKGKANVHHQVLLQIIQ